MATKNYDDQVRIYALANVSSFSAQSDAISRLVFQALRVSPSAKRTVTLTPGSGWLDYTDSDELWTRKSPPALPEQAAALKVAEDLLNQLERLCSDANPAWPAQLRGKALLPPVTLLRRSSLQAILRPDGSTWDHWLYRAQPQLIFDGGGKTRAPVSGAQIEVRIGHMGRVVSLRSRWTPLAPVRKLVSLSAYDPPPSAPDDDAEQQVQEPFLAFLLEGSHVPQFYLAPYYFTTDTHGATAVSASPFSLTVDIGDAPSANRRTTVMALAEGGSGDYLYSWACYSNDRIHQGLQLIGGGRSQAVKGRSGPVVTSSIELDTGAYTVLVNVKDRQTGAFKHQQAQVFPAAILETVDGDALPPAIA